MESIEKALADQITANAEKLLKLFSGQLIKIDEKLRIKIGLAYKEYLKTSYAKTSKTRTFFFRNHSPDLYTYYVPSGLSCGDIQIQNPDVETCLAHARRIAITGYGGSGKSVLLKHLFLDTIRKGKHVPVLIELRDLNQNSQNLSQLIETNLSTLGFDTSGDLIKLAKAEGHFAFFLDGYDEVGKAQQQKIISEIRTIATKSSGCPIFITSRPDDIFYGLSEFDVFEINPLSVEAATNLISKLPVNPSLKDRFIKEIPKLFESHQSFLSNPLLLSIMLLTYGENAEIPAKLSVFYNQAFEALFHRHDALKEGGLRRERLTDLDIQDFSKVFSAFCIQTYHQGITNAPRTEILRFIRKSRKSLGFSFDDQAFLSDLLVSVCLLIEDGLEISFAHRSFQEYFTAIHIKNSNPEAQKVLIETFWPEKNRDEIFNLLVELDNELVEREIIIPEFNNFIEAIGYKKKIGITHFLRYMKLCFHQVSVGENTTRATTRSSRKDKSKNFKELISLVNKKYNPYGFRVRQIPRAPASFYTKYKGDGARRHYPTDALTIKSPLIIDLSKSEGFFSIKYLECLIEFHKELLEKHKNPRKKIDFLLNQVDQ